MLAGLLLLGVAGVFDEIANTIGKDQAIRKKETVYTIGLIRTMWAVVILLIPVLIGLADFSFSAESLPTFSLRIILEVILSFIAVKELVIAERSTVTIFSVLTVPFLLVIDVFFGYVTSVATILFIAFAVVLTLGLSLVDKKISKKGIGYVISAALIAVVTTQLYKYNIENYNSVAAEQLIIISIMSLFYFVMSSTHEKHLLSLLRSKKVVMQSLSSGVSIGLYSFSIYYLPPSILIAGKRILRMFFGLLSGKFYFNEEHGLHKFAVVSIVSILVVLSAYFS